MYWQGRPIHSLQPWQLKNAIEYAYEMLEKLMNLAEERLKENPNSSLIGISIIEGKWHQFLDECNRHLSKPY